MRQRWLLSIITFFIIFTGVDTNNVEAAKVSELTKIAKDYIGAPYKLGGTNINSGLDCSAYTQFVYKQLGVSLKRTSSTQFQQGKSVQKSDLKEGDLVFFNTSGKGISHVGIYIGSGKFISATPSSGVRIDKLNDPYYWGSRYLGAKRIV